MANALSLNPHNAVLAAAERRVERDRVQVQDARQRLARSQEQLQKDERERDALRAESRVGRAFASRSAADAENALPAGVGKATRSAALGSIIDVYA